LLTLRFVRQSLGYVHDMHTHPMPHGTSKVNRECQLRTVDSVQRRAHSCDCPPVWQTPDGFITSRPCNRFLCPDALTIWSVGPWEPCIPGVAPVPACSGGAGTKTRTVVCTSAAGSVLADDACAGATYGTATGTTKPPPSLPCTIAPTCNCTVDSDCPSTHWVCASTTHRCECSALWRGDACDVPLLLGAEGAPPCTEGIIDASGTCTMGFIDTVTGLSCREGEDVDWAGRCCTTGPVDACGVCGGTGVAVDVLGRCCLSALLPSGLCCEDGEPDSCGVCGGLNTCT
jgi:hypothetical protein